MKQLPVRMFVVFLALLSWGNASQAASAPETFVPFQEFLDGVSGADFEAYAAREGAGVENAAEFQRMRRHVLSMYEGVEVQHSFVLDAQHFDCVPVEQQPSVRALGRETLVLEAPVLPAAALDNPAPEGVRRAASPLTLGLDDSFGNAIHCDEGTIPLRRVTLEEMSRFGTLQGFFGKTPFGEAGPPRDGITKAAATHKYAHARQSVTNYGGNSWLNLWSPPINTGKGQIFSLSQHWYTGGSGQNTPKCYTLKLTPSSSGGDWGTYFFFGGPGGNSC